MTIWIIGWFFTLGVFDPSFGTGIFMIFTWPIDLGLLVKNIIRNHESFTSSDCTCTAPKFPSEICVHYKSGKCTNTDGTCYYKGER
jgi:hypothetical protein